jgi:hypothetical protein
VVEGAVVAIFGLGGLCLYRLTSDVLFRCWRGVGV